MESYDIDYECNCKKCGHSPIHSRPCNEIMCDDGQIEDPFNDFYDGSGIFECDECKGTGIEIWCPSCGANLSGIAYK